VADVPVDSVRGPESGAVQTAVAPYPGRRRAQVPVDAPVQTRPRDDVPAEALDTGAIELVLSALEPVDQTTSFAHEPTTQLPMLRAEPPATAGKRRAVKHSGRRGPLFKGMPSAPVLLGIAALAVSIGGAVTINDADTVSSARDAGVPPVTHAASALGGSSGQATFAPRSKQVSRDSSRDAQSGAAGEDLQDAAEGLAVERNTALKQFSAAAEKQAKILAKDAWQYPLEPVILTARFGQTGLWSSYHTGLDFNGNTGDQIHAIANGEVISAGYDGSYGNKTVIRLEDGTELWYCHQSAFLVSVGDTVTGGEIIGLVGATGHVTGSHLHVEVHPGGGDAVDPYTAMEQHGMFLGSEAQPG
jgi:murein DD-endopeptidase MepM/ murein hydrolase activator NlpD